MCRSIKTLFNFDPPVTESEIHAASLQFVRKLSGFTAPSKANEAAFDAAVEDIAAVSITGLKGHSYLDKVANFAKKTETGEAIRVTSEVDRIYLDATGTVDIHDGKLGRVIRVAKKNSSATVVWNPWIAKAQQMPDFGNEEYQKMVCVESGNVNVNKLTLAPGKKSTLKVTLSSLAK